eukprot:2945607-Amphidinium_carterae.1
MIFVPNAVTLLVICGAIRVLFNNCSSWAARKAATEVLKKLPAESIFQFRAYLDTGLRQSTRLVGQELHM